MSAVKIYRTIMSSLVATIIEYYDMLREDDHFIIELLKVIYWVRYRTEIVVLLAKGEIFLNIMMTLVSSTISFE